MRRININTQRNSVTLVLLLVIFFLSLGHVLVHIPSAFYGYSGNMFGLFRFFNLGAETGLATYISSLNFLLAGGLLSLIALHESHNESRNVIYWWGLSAGFLVMSFDESTQIHERIVGSLTKYMFGSGEGIFHFGWTRAYIPLVVIVAFLFFPFLKKVGSKYATGFTLSGVVFLSGAIGLEMAGSYMEDYNVYVGKYDGIRVLAEEFLEMLGIVIFIHFLVSYISEKNMITNVKIVIN